MKYNVPVNWLDGIIYFDPTTVKYNEMRNKRMVYNEEKGDLFAHADNYFLAHCISADFGMGAGIAVQFNKRYQMQEKLQQHYRNYITEFRTSQGSCILVSTVFNLVTKERYYQKPTMQTLKNALYSMKRLCSKSGVTKIAMPKIGCGLDRLKWANVKQLIQEVFKDTNIEILVCYL